MQDWVLITAPIVGIGYFLVHPGQLVAFMHWFARLLY
jgi:hypothetical protein